MAERFAVYEASEPGLLDANGAECVDKSPAGRCWCKLKREIAAGTKPGTAITQCAKLAGAEVITAPVGRSECTFLTGSEEQPLIPSEGCSCADVSPVYAEVIDNGVVSCRPTAIGDARRIGIYTVTCRPEKPWNPSPREIFIDPICVTATDGTRECDSSSRLLSPSGSTTSTLPLRTKEYLFSSFARMDHKLRRSRYGCASSSSYVVPTPAPSPSPSPTPSDGFVEPPPTALKPIEDDDDWALPNTRDANLITELEQYSIDTVIFDPTQHVLVAPESTTEYKFMTALYPWWFQAWIRKAQLSNAGIRLSVAQARINAAMHSLKILRNSKKLALLTLKEMAQSSRIYEEKKHSAFVGKQITSIAFVAVSHALNFTPITAMGKVIVSGVGSVVGAAVDKAVGPDESAETTNAKIALTSGMGGAKYMAKEACKATTLAPARRMMMAAVISSTMNSDRAGSLTLLKEVERNAGVFKFTKDWVGTSASGLTTVASTWWDSHDYITRNIAADNPWEIAMQQGEAGIKILNQHIAELKAELGATVALRNKEVAQARAIYCRAPDGSTLNDPEQCAS